MPFLSGNLRFQEHCSVRLEKISFPGDFFFGRFLLWEIALDIKTQRNKNPPVARAWLLATGGRKSEEEFHSQVRISSVAVSLATSN
jgi:hypothetical protein